MVTQITEAGQKVFVNDENTVSLHCPECDFSKIVDVSKYLKSVSQVKFKVKCYCGNSFSIILERRECPRKVADIQGTFIYYPTLGHKVKGSMTVLDISSGGIKLKTNELLNVKKGDAMEVEFNLDHTEQSLVKKLVVVRNVNLKIINAQFCFFNFNEPGDIEIEYYLF